MLALTWSMSSEISCRCMVAPSLVSSTSSMLCNPTVLIQSELAILLRASPIDVLEVPETGHNAGIVLTASSRRCRCQGEPVVPYAAAVWHER